MKNSELMIRCLAMREGQHWVGICLPFDLAAQAETLDEVKIKVDAQIRDYLRDALVGQDRDHAAMLLGRRAPLKYWLLYGLATIVGHVRTHAGMVRFRTPVPLAPAHC